MSTSLPPPIALRSFEAAARNLSFTRAASELNVTQAAISHQVKLLEQNLGVPLFVRLTRKILLTTEGQSLYSVVNESFNSIAEVSESLRRGTEDEILNVSLTPYFSAKWLTVRLSRFWASHPKIDLRLHHTAQPGNFEQNEIDIAISWGQDDWSGLDTRLLLSARVVPVCSPGLITRDRPLNSIDDLYQYTLLHENDYSLWTLWLKRSGVKDVNLRRGSTMDDANVILQAAIDGQGIALGADLLLQDELASGKLIMPFDPTLSMKYAYYIVYQAGALERPKINAFYQWLLQESKSG
jgi:LysR family glycine cleavage system transcriptional activator